MPTITEQKNLRKMQRLLSLMDDDALTREDFTKYFSQVLDFLKKMKDANAQEMAAMLNAIKNAMMKMENDQTEEMVKIKKEMMMACDREIKTIMAEHKSRMVEMDNKAAEMRSMMPDEAIIAKTASEMAVSEVLKTLPLKDDLNIEISKAGDLIATALENQPEEKKLEIKAIKDLQKMLDELRQLKTQRLGGGGGFSKIHMEGHLVDNELVGTGNGVTTAFSLISIPNPTNSLHIVVGTSELFLTDDWTISGKTITFLTAPPDGAKIRGTYRS